tara:strand:- start:315 stop:1163 length:849 start_codon:yes stop_codon:yes gene_type:complete
MISSFKIAIVLICTYYSAINIYTYFDLELYKVGATAKSYTGSQRYGFVHILALTIVLFSTYNKFLYRFLSVIPFFIIFTGGLLLSFSRSSVISFFICIFIFFIFEFFKFKSNISKIKLLFILFFLILIVYLSSIYFNSATLFFEASIFGKDNLFHDILNPESSAGYRFFMFYKILQHTIDNILTGSGFLGVWIMFEDKIGSAHSQYGDILFRTGFIGTIVFLYLISRVCFFLLKFEKSFFYGFIGILAYGLFHETFKISQGAFIFAFFLGLMNSSGSRYIKF